MLLTEFMPRTFDLAIQQKLLIIGQSARMLACAAQRSGLNPIPK